MKWTLNYIISQIVYTNVIGVILIQMLLEIGKNTMNTKVSD
jgi:hypothetical protein